MNKMAHLLMNFCNLVFYQIVKAEINVQPQTT